MSDRSLNSISIAATFTAEPLSSGLTFLLKHLGLDAVVRFAPYGQLFQQLLSGGELLSKNSKGVNVILIRIEDFVRDVTDRSAVPDVIGQTTRELKTALASYASRAKVPTIISVLSSGDEAFQMEIRSANADLVSCVCALPGMIVLSSEEIDKVTSGPRYDTASNDLAHIPFTMEHYSSLALAIARKVHASLVPAHKVLVLDCDNTIWRGVVGEDGLGGITISPAFAELQRFALNVHQQGVLICLVSKNAERDVLEVFEKRSDMILKLDQVVAYRINWDSKPQNLRSIAQSLNLGLDSFVFLDDNPVECALMEAELPQVVTLQVPGEDRILSFLSNIWAFDKISVTDEDVRRTQMYKEDAARQQFEESSADIADFIASLQVVTDIEPPINADWPRLSQLTQRTNQFNFSTIRRTEPELRALEKEGATILRVRVKDRFGDYGLVGMVIARYETDCLVVDTFLLSCRVLGRGVEHAILRKLGDIAVTRKISLVVIPLVPTSKNEPARAFVDSVAQRYRHDEPDRMVFAIPSSEVRSVAHRPGHDPVEVINASKSVARTLSSDSKATVITDRSLRYLALARDLTTGEAVAAAVKFQNTRSRELLGDAALPTTDCERRMLALWEDILGVSALGIDDDYFALGGTSLAAASMFAEISRRFGIRLPLTTILTSPTVRLLTRHVSGRQATTENALLELKRGTSRNVFLVHDGDGETLLYSNLARRLPNEVAVFAINPYSIRNVPLAHASIERMAEFYIRKVREKQPFGPYCLGGMCAGGVIAFEMANQLIEQGEVVELVALLDAATPQAARRTGRIAKQRLERLSQLFAKAGGIDRSLRGTARLVETTVAKTLNALRWETTSRIKKWSVRARFKLLRNLIAKGGSWPARIPGLSVRQIYECAEEEYIPKKISAATILVVRATRGEAGDTPYVEVFSDPTLGWGAVASRLSTVDVEGGHFTMLQEPAVEHLASVLRAALAPESPTHLPLCATEETA